jgi:hypothetical protein
MVELRWNANFEAKEGPLTESLKISGPLIDTSVCLNGWSVRKGEFDSIASQGSDTVLMIDHSKSVRDIIGKVNKGYNKDNKVYIDAEIDDPQIQALARKGLVKYFSIGATADAVCSGCGKDFKMSCKCKNAHQEITNVKLKEVSVVLDPAFSAAEFKPFEASVNSALEVTPNSAQVEGGTQNKKVEENRNMSETKEATKAVSAGPDAVILLAEMEGLKKELLALKQEKKAEEDAKAKKAKEEEEAKKESKKEEVFTRLESVLTRLEKKLEKPCEDEDEDEDKKPAKKEVKKEPEEDEEKPKKEEKKASKGGKIEDAEGKTITANATGVPAWIAEVADAAKKAGILD